MFRKIFLWADKRLLLTRVQTADGVITCATIKDVTDEVYAERERTVLGDLARIIRSAADIEVVFEQFADQVFG